MAELLSVHEKVTGTNVQVHAFRSLNFSTKQTHQCNGNEILIKF